MLFVLLRAPDAAARAAASPCARRSKLLGVVAAVGARDRRSVGGAQPHHVREAHAARHRVRLGAALRQLRRRVLRPASSGTGTTAARSRTTRPTLEETVARRRWPARRPSTTSSDHKSRVPVVVAARVGRIWDVYRPFQNVELNDRSANGAVHVASWAVLIGYWLVLPFAIGGLVVLRRRRIPIFPFLAIVAVGHDHGGARASGSPATARRSTPCSRCSPRSRIDAHLAATAAPPARRHRRRTRT